MHSIKKGDQRRRRKRSAKLCTPIGKIEDASNDDDTVVMAISLPEVEPSHETSRSYPLWVYCAAVGLTVLLSIGIVLGVLLSTSSEDKTSQSFGDSPIDTPGSDSPPTSNPTDAARSDNDEMDEKCLKLSSGTAFQWTETMNVQSFDIHMDVMLKFESDLPILLSGLEERIQEVLLPKLAGCSSISRQNSFERRDYSIENAIVEARLQEDDACLPKSVDSPCYRVIATLAVQLEENGPNTGLNENVIEVFGKDPLVKELGLLLPFQKIEIVEMALVSPSYPSASPPQFPTPTAGPAAAPITPTEVVATYVPGKLNVYSNGLVLSEGLTSRIIARTGQPVALTAHFDTEIGGYHNSSELFHDEPDGAAVFEWPETGGWVHVTNSEVKDIPNAGGVSALYFDKDGQVVDFKKLLTGTTSNCAGGKTPWNSWVSCEEAEGGRVFQVDPFGRRETEEMTIDAGVFESFAHDIRNSDKPRFFVSEDKDRGPLRRFTPSTVDWDDPWNMLHSNGTLEYLILQPHNNTNNTEGSFLWTTDKAMAKDNAQSYYRSTEGIDVYNNQLFVVSKTQDELFILDLDAMTYESHPTVYGLFDGHPDQMKRLLQDGLLYFCEEGGKENGVHARDDNGWFFTILESVELTDETTGLAFSPDAKHMYVSYQHNGIIFDISREDGLPFHWRTINVKYHELGAER